VALFIVYKIHSIKIQKNVSKSMQRLASGQQNIAPGDRTASSAVAWGMKAEAASLKIGIQNGTEAMQAVEMLNNDIQAMNCDCCSLGRTLRVEH
jgi:flagellin-like hook-associated protein FlgL